jgi:2-oxoglutarate dehydrogenase E2 component (dihydrolipoamide succinyltransferase)
MTDIRVPKLNNNDTEYILLEWIVGDDEPVGPDDPIAMLETSKAAAELTSEGEGVLRHLKPEGAECRPGEVIAQVVPAGAPREDTPGSAADGALDRPTMTAPARALMAELDVTLDEVRALGIPLIKTAQVQQIADARSAPGNADPGSPQDLPAGQRAVARTVALSHRTIPSAYALVRVDVGAALVEARQAAKRLRLLVGLPELAVTAVARLHASFPLLYASPLAQDGPLRSVMLAATANVGVTMDVGKGLTVPVVRDASTLSFEDLTRTLTAFRDTALRGAFSEDQLAGGNITVTLHTDPDVVLAVPVVFPGQTCALSVAGARAETAPTAEDPLRTRTVTDLGLAYDHRIVNGRDAVLYLQAVKRLLESPAQLTGA